MVSRRLCAVVAFFCVLPAVRHTFAWSSRNAADIAVIDRAIAAAAPGQEWVRFGDVGMRVADLKMFRDRLIALDNPEGTQNPEPYSDTPNGTAFKWPSGVVNYRFDPTQVANGTLTAAKMRQFRDSAAEWTAFANVTFNEFSGAPPTNYITVLESSGSEGGFSSAVGMAGGEQFIQIGPTSWNRGTICHEVGHALGLYHEQQRDDRDNYVVINFGNMDPTAQGNFTKLPGGSTARGAYDFFSVMHYSRTALSNNGMDTISMQPAYIQFADIIGNVFDRTLSTLDRAGMALVYGNPVSSPSATVTNTRDSGPGSLRTAIYFAFDRSLQSLTTSIQFHIPNTDPNFSGGVFTIQPSYIMTAPGAGTTIDATTQTAFTGDTNNMGPEVVLNGTVQAQYEMLGGVHGPGFTLRQNNCAVKGFVIQGYNQGAILIESAASGNVVGGNYIGTDKTGTSAVPNGVFPGIEINSGAHNNTIGGSMRNLISGGGQYGISINGSGTNSNVVTGNYIGTNAGGTSALPNAAAGVSMFGGAQSNTIGGTISNLRNLISGNLNQGVQITGAGTSGNVVQGNYIGVNVTGSAAIPNGLRNPANHEYIPGVGIDGGATNNKIGGSVLGSANVISGNAGGGIAIAQAGTSGNTVLGNFIGTNPNGMSAIPNGAPEPGQAFSGVSILSGALNNTIGGTVSGSGNLISGNGAAGVLVFDAGTNGNMVQGNFIGVTSLSGPLGNTFYGVGIFGGAQMNTVGGTVTMARNVISGNAFNGVIIGGTDTNQNMVQGNYIGTEANGTSVIANGSPGVTIFGEAKNNIVGGTVAGARNVISGNGSREVEISGLGTTGNTIQGNYLGLDPTGAVLPNLNNDGAGIYDSAQNNTFGGTTPGARNYVCGHSGYGLFLSDANTSGNQVQGNTIGLTPIGATAGNMGYGIGIFNSAQANLIGGSALGASNVISANGADGVGVFGLNSVTIKNTISRNAIFGNGGKGVGLYDGGNNSQPFPTLNTASVSTATNPNGTDVAGSLTAAPNTTYLVEFFANVVPEPSGFGEGQIFIGAMNVTTNGAGTVNFTASLAAALPLLPISATATDPLGNTSQFAQNRMAIPTTDTDGDGMPNNYENAHGLNSSMANANVDSDGDGLTNGQEFKAGTDPTSANSALRITAFDRSTSSPRVSFPVIAGKTYRLEYKDDLTVTPWILLTGGIYSTSSTTLQITDPSGASVSKRFYQVTLDQ